MQGLFFGENILVITFANPGFTPRPVCSIISSKQRNWEGNLTSKAWVSSHFPLKIT